MSHVEDPIPLSKIPHFVSHVEENRFGHELWSPRFVTEYWKVFSHICHAIAMS